MGDSVPKHTGPNSLTDTSSNRASPEPDRPPPERIAGDGMAFYQRRSSCLPMQLFGVEIDSFLPHG